MEMEESVPETTEEPQNQPQTPRSLLWSVFPSWVGLLCLFVVAWVINLTLMGLDWGIRHNLGPLRTLTISPFATIVKEFSPYSAVPCIFPVLTSQELDSFACSCKYAKTGV